MQLRLLTRAIRTPRLARTMVEGHSVHRVATRHRQHLVGKCFRATSPNGRFTAGAAAIDGRRFSRIEAVGKNLFCWFESTDGAILRAAAAVCHDDDDAFGGAHDGAAACSFLRFFDASPPPSSRPAMAYMSGVASCENSVRHSASVAGARRDFTAASFTGRVVGVRTLRPAVARSPSTVALALTGRQGRRLLRSHGLPA